MPNWTDARKRSQAAELTATKHEKFLGEDLSCTLPKPTIVKRIDRARGGGQIRIISSGAITVM